MISADDVRAIHDRILETEEGLHGEPRAGVLEGAVARIDQRLHYSHEPLDIFDVAALYAVAIAKAHAFNDGNKRTALVCALTLLEQNGHPVPTCPQLEEAMVDVAEGLTDEIGFAMLLYWLRVPTAAPEGPDSLG
jgi:death-on-curing protein